MVIQFLTTASDVVSALSCVLFVSLKCLTFLSASAAPLNATLWTLRSTAFFLCLASDQVEDLLGEGDHDAARHGEHTIGALGGIVTLEGQTHLQDAKAQQDESNGTDE